jgi:hypothetical protein
VSVTPTSAEAPKASATTIVIDANNAHIIFLFMPPSFSDFYG